MNITASSGNLKRFRKTPWRFQQTVRTPLQEIDRFVAVILKASPKEIQAATLTISQIVFDATHLSSLDPLASAIHLAYDTAIEGETAEEAKRLLAAALRDWVDFLFVPMPKSFVIFADHDEYTTFYANTRGALNAMTNPLAEAGFALIEGWNREL